MGTLFHRPARFRVGGFYLDCSARRLVDNSVARAQYPKRRTPFDLCHSKYAGARAETLQEPSHP